MSIERTDERLVSAVVTQLVGPLPDVLEAIKEEMKRYDPRGYGTQVKYIGWTPGGNGELFVNARIWRAKSCD